MTDRRSFLRTLTASAAASTLVQGVESSDKLGTILPTRVLGRTGERITSFTLGGAHCEHAETDTESQKIIETAIELGVRSFDNARTYGEGKAETIYGKFLVPKYRDQIFLTTKTTKTTGKEVRQELEISLRNLKTDHLDLWQIHAIQSPEDVDERIKNGVLDEFLKAREEGKTRYLGFTGHTSFQAHLHMLKRLRENGTPLDTCLMPINLVDPHFDSFIVNVLPQLIEEKYAIFAMKTLACGMLLGEPPVWRRGIDEKPHSLTEKAGLTATDMHHYAYSLPITSLISGCEKTAQLRQNIDILHAYKGMNAEKRDKLLEKAKPFAGKHYEFYKKPIA